MKANIKVLLLMVGLLLPTASQAQIKRCSVCKKSISNCTYHGNHPKTDGRLSIEKKPHREKLTESHIYSNSAKDWNQLGDDYFHGENGKSKNIAEAFRWYKKAAEAGYAEAQSNLGWMYVNGYGVEKNYQAAFTWFMDAAENGNANGQRNLADMYYAGLGVPKDYYAARMWYQKAAEQGLAAAQYSLGKMYEHGEGVEMNMKEAMRWYQKSANNGYAKAKKKLKELQDSRYDDEFKGKSAKEIYIIGNDYYDGKNGKIQSYHEAVKWYKRASEMGYASAQVNMGYMYEHGYGVEKDEKIAVYWYLKSAEQGNATGQFNIGIMYEHGRGVPKDLSEANRWYKLSAAQGHLSAINKLKIVQQNNVISPQRKSLTFMGISLGTDAKSFERALRAQGFKDGSGFDISGNTIFLKGTVYGELSDVHLDVSNGIVKGITILNANYSNKSAAIGRFKIFKKNIISNYGKGKIPYGDAYEVILPYGKVTCSYGAFGSGIYEVIMTIVSN